MSELQRLEAYFSNAWHMGLVTEVELAGLTDTKAAKALAVRMDLRAKREKWMRGAQGLAYLHAEVRWRDTSEDFIMSMSNAVVTLIGTACPAECKHMSFSNRGELLWEATSNRKLGLTVHMTSGHTLKGQFQDVRGVWRLDSASTEYPQEEQLGW
jgi:hypothetical protein